MLKLLPARVAIDRQAKFRFAIVASEYNAKFVDGLVEAARREIAAAMPGATVSIRRVPGAFEVPFAVQEAVRDAARVDAVIAFGVILQGKTAHADLIAGSVTEALMGIMLETRVPVIHGVLHCSPAQARVRCLQARGNRGTEAARVAMQMAKFRRPRR